MKLNILYSATCEAGKLRETNRAGEEEGINRAGEGEGIHLFFCDICTTLFKNCF